MIKIVLNTVRSGLRTAVINKLQQSFFQVFIQIVLTRIGANRISGMTHLWVLSVQEAGTLVSNLAYTIMSNYAVMCRIIMKFQWHTGRQDTDFLLADTAAAIIRL